MSRRHPTSLALLTILSLVAADVLGPLARLAFKGRTAPVRRPSDLLHLEALHRGLAPSPLRTSRSGEDPAGAFMKKATSSR